MAKLMCPKSSKKNVIKIESVIHISIFFITME